MTAYDAVVAGAGPAGAVAAALLARAGRAVLLVAPPDGEAHRIGECLPAAGAQLLARLGLPAPRRNGPHEPIAGVHSRWGSEEAVHDAFNDPGGGGWRLDRACFDRDLREAAVAAGAAVLSDSIVGLEREAAHWRLRTRQGGSAIAAAVIDATGRRAALARRIGAVQTADDPLVAVWALGSPLPPGYTRRTLIETAPGGWWYGAVLPGGTPLAAFHCHPRLAGALAADPGRWRSLLAASSLLQKGLGSGRFDHARLFRVDARGLTLRPGCGPGWFAVGDAALSFDPVASQGIFNAVATAAMAAGAVTAGDTAAARAGYAARLAAIREAYRRRLHDLTLRLAVSAAATGTDEGAAMPQPCGTGSPADRGVQRSA